MTLDDLPLERSDPRPPSPAAPQPPPPSSSSPIRWIVLGAAAVLVGGALTLWWLSRAQPGTATPASTAPTDVVVSNRPKRQALDLPPLDDSDTLLRQFIAALSRHPQLAKLLATQGLIRSATLATVQIGEGKTPASPFSVLRPATRLDIVGNAPTGRLDPTTYARWDSNTAALVSIDPRDLAQVYVNTELLFDQAYQELGHPSAKFDEAIVRAIDTLGETPVVSQDLILIRKQPGFFDHEDPNLRTLLPVQKQFLLMGPENRRKIMDWLKRLATDLDLKFG